MSDHSEADDARSKAAACRRLTAAAFARAEEILRARRVPPEASTRDEPTAETAAELMRRATADALRAWRLMREQMPPPPKLRDALLTYADALDAEGAGMALTDPYRAAAGDVEAKRRVADREQVVRDLDAHRAVQVDASAYAEAHPARWPVRMAVRALLAAMRLTGHTTMSAADVLDGVLDDIEAAA